ncbi:TetR family transcriptional regulator [Sedimentitalea sp. JM2-8]|uniref:TetR family transcriptional regulator n=1 Tax=Sedimentitalea xiamensis TaxID=3050037 RepID=A0ABT7FFB6_9RHOB|nr:TetR family transcriptional regulator [Sedimentitalea xiamensis]MDK3073831.1 TetR family transcriptional regulator [Sedimentitalea xiamensis]
MDGGAERPAKARKTSWKKDPEAVRQNILAIATEEFAAHGLSGANINEIARRTSTSKRMIYYYFGDKEGLYCAVLEGVYAFLRRSEDLLDVAGLDPVKALRRLIEATFDAHANAPHFIRLVMIENIHNADYLRKSDIVPNLNRSIIDKLSDVCRRGKAEGLFRAGADPLELHWLISSFSFYNVSNRATFSASFGTSLYSKAHQAALKERLADMVMAAVVIGHDPKSWS